MEAKQKAMLLELAKNAIKHYLSTGKTLAIDESKISKALKREAGVFVSLHKNGELRGCIGYIQPVKPLYLAVVENAINAAVNDPRFPRLSPEELDSVEIEISVLSKPEKLNYSSWQELLEKLDKNKGVILKCGARQATFLPQVWEQLPKKELFMAHLALKAGLSPDAWKNTKVEIFSYNAEVFSEK